jgi:hypothetical protein
MIDDTEFVALWQRVDGELRSIIETAPLSPDCACEATEYLDHNEFALAWEMLAACLRDAEPAIRERMRAVELMLYPPDLGW